jgi:outer membrane lipoprotein-sorting protein
MVVTKREYVKVIRKILIFIIVMMLSSLLCLTGNAIADTLLKLIELQRSIRTIKAEFIQEKHSELLHKPIITRGTFFFASPDKFVWDYNEGLKVVSDGKNVLIYYKDIKEADMGDINSIPSLPAGFSLEKLKERYRIDVIQSAESSSVVKLTPLIPSGMIQELLITLDEKGVPVEISMTERTQDKIRITFPKREFNLAIPDETFSTRAPEGVKVRKRTK